MALFTSLTLRDLALANRIVVSPMCQYSAVDGRASDWHTIHWGQLLLSGAGLFTIEATAVTEEGRISPGDLGLYDDACEAALGETLARVRRQAPPVPVALQLAHAGRKGSSRAPWDGGGLIPLDAGGWVMLAPSALPHAAGERAPQALDAAGLSRLRDAYVAAARRAERGSFDNRVRFPLEVFDAVRNAWPESKPLGVRLSCTDWVDGGWTLEQSVRLAGMLGAHGCDFIDCSSGGISPLQKIPLSPGYQVPFAREIRC